ncbi:MAG: SDR family oxidoreductase [Pseudomonadota bacterium]|nr:SDR family oxidoreductase [Pseudomonadota bacterium]MEC9207676.1 SDR family oxidoreductase [Pseudomonadota bacterium]
MDLGINKKRALLLASSSGLGYAAALALASEGVHVCVSGSDRGRAEAAARQISSETGGTAVGLHGDLADPANMIALHTNATTALNGSIDILLLNHGGPPLRKALEVSNAELSKHANNMMLSLIRVSQIALPNMRTGKWGRIIMVGAPAVGEPIPNNVLSNLFRGSMANYCKTLAGEVISDGVTVNIISPSAIRTERTTDTAKQRGALKGISGEEEMAAREAGTIAQRFGTPKEFGAMVAFMASDLAGYTTGVNIRVDGGSAMGII